MLGTLAPSLGTTGRPASVSQTATPVSQTAIPVSQTAVPVSQTAVPVSQTAIPVSQTAVPLSQTAAPVSQTAAPVSQTAAPLSQTVSRSSSRSGARRRPGTCGPRPRTHAAQGRERRCLGRRMARTAAHLVDPVLPEQVPLRQWVRTVPFESRARLACDAELLGGASREFASAVLDFYRRRFEPGGVRGGKSGAVTVVQRSSSDLRLNPHYHLVPLDGVSFSV
jgi:hypothetical protein